MNLTPRTLIAVALVSFLGACSTPERFKGVDIGRTPTLITSVPPLLQTRRISCGPTCVAAVVAYWGKDYSRLITNSPPALAEDFSAADLLGLVQSLDLKSFAYSGSIDDFENNLRNGRPVVVLIPRPHYQHTPDVSLNGFSVQAIWDMVAPKYSHWVIGIGFTEADIILQDPACGTMIVSRSKFESWWNAKKRTCVLISP